jgi:hypothetical protein
MLFMAQIPHGHEHLQTERHGRAAGTTASYSGRSEVQKQALKPAILTKIYGGYIQSLQASAPSFHVIHCSLIILSLHASHHIRTHRNGRQKKVLIKDNKKGNKHTA